VTLVMYIVTCVQRLGRIIVCPMQCMQYIAWDRIYTVFRKNTHALTVSFISPRMMRGFKQKIQLI